MKILLCLVSAMAIFFTTACSIGSSQEENRQGNVSEGNMPDSQYDENQVRFIELSTRLRQRFNSNNYPDYFGGFYMNDEGMLVVNVTEFNAEIEQVIKDAIESNEVIIKEVEYSYLELNEIVDFLNEFRVQNIESEAEFIQNIEAHGMDIKNNRIITWLRDDSAEQIQAFKNYILDSPMIEFEQGEVTENRVPDAT